MLLDCWLNSRATSSIPFYAQALKGCHVSCARSCLHLAVPGWRPGRLAPAVHGISGPRWPKSTDGATAFAQTVATPKTPMA